MNKVLVNMSSNILSTLLGVLAPLIAIPILTSNMGMAMYGQYITMIALSALLVVVTDLGLAMYLAKRVSESRNDLVAVSKYVSTFILVKVIAGGLVAFIIMYWLDQSALLTSLLAVLTLMNALNISPILNGTEDYKFIAKATVLSKGGFLLLIIGSSYQEISIEKAIFFQILSVVLLNFLLFNFLFCKKKIFLVKLSLTQVFMILKAAFFYYFARLFVNIYNQSSTYFVSLFLASELVAVYSIAMQLYKAGQVLIGSIARVLFTNLVHTKDFTLLKKSTLVVLFINFISLPIVFWIGEDILSLIFDFNTTLLHELSIVLYISLNFVTISSFWGYPALSAIGQEKYAHLGIFCSSFSYYLLFSILISFDALGIYETIVCVVFADFVAMILRCYFANKFKLFKL